MEDNGGSSVSPMKQRNIYDDDEDFLKLLLELRLRPITGHGQLPTEPL